MSNQPFDQLITDALQGRENSALPPVDKWNTPLSGDIDIVINSKGEWFHEGDLITRTSLVKVFASILKKEGDDYFLISPVEKWRIQVEDVPFIIIDLQVITQQDQQALLFTTSTGDTVVADQQHRLYVVVEPETGEPSPYLMVRGGMEGKLNRNVFYQLAELAEEHVVDGKTVLAVGSMGQFFTLE